MTRAELSLHHEAQRKLNEARELYKQMRLRAYPKAQVIDDMPKATGTGRKVEELALVLTDMAEKIAELENLTATEEEIEAEYARLAEAYQMEAEQIKGMIPAESVSEDLRVKAAMELVKANAVAPATAE